MKILHVCESLVGGPASYFEEVIPFQVSEFGRDAVIVLVPRQHRSALGASVDCRIETFNRSGRNLSSFFELWKQFRKTTKTFVPDIVHLHGTFSGVIGRLATAFLRNRPKIVYCAHCWSFDRSDVRLRHKAFEWIERYLAPFTDMLISISPHEITLLQERNIKFKHNELVVSGIRDDISHCTDVVETESDATSQLKLLFIGRFDEQKGLDLLFREFEALPPGRVSLAVVGAKVLPGGNTEFPRDVVMHGWVPRDRLSDLIAQADAVIMPSRWEGMPLVALEVLRAGRPILASNIGPFPHILTDEVNGVLMNICAKGFLKNALDRLENLDLRRMKIEARKAYEQKFNGNRMNYELLSSYKIIARPKLGSRGSEMNKGAASIQG
ncbi:glycosyltransferase [Paraburkholderia sediminicola]|uniref:glycosyltransferase n=1 Tax=Paraburkholderia sediminicola TaxID=458836 RepID=UPI0038B6F2D1